MSVTEGFRTFAKASFGVGLLLTLYFSKTKQVAEGFRTFTKVFDFGIGVLLTMLSPAKQKTPHKVVFFVLAEAEGFEPPWGCPQTVFKTASL